MVLFRVILKLIIIPYPYYTLYCILIKDPRGNSFFSDTEAFFLITQVQHNHWFVWLLQLNQWWQRSCTAFGCKARQSPPEWLYNAGIHQGSSDFFSFIDDYKIFTLRDSKPSPLNEASQRIQTSLCSVNSPLLSSPQRLQHSLLLFGKYLLREL